MRHTAVLTGYIPCSLALAIMETSGITDAVNRLKGTFLEIPGTKLKPAEAARLCGLETPVCGIVLDALEDAGFLRRASDGSFTRAGSEGGSL